MSPLAGSEGPTKPFRRLVSRLSLLRGGMRPSGLVRTSCQDRTQPSQRRTPVWKDWNPISRIARPHRRRHSPDLARIDRPVDKRRASHPLPLPRAYRAMRAIRAGLKVRSSP
jgi:hypothetical protein